MPNQQIVFQYRSPIIKQITGLFYAGLATVPYYLWANNPPSFFVKVVMCIGFTLLTVLGLYQGLSYTVSLFHKDKREAVKVTYFFGVWKKTTTSTFDFISSVPDANIPGFWGIYIAYSDQKLQDSYTEEELEMMKNKTLNYPGFVVIDAINRKRAKQVLLELQTHYDLLPEISEVVETNDDLIDDDDEQDFDED